MQNFKDKKWYFGLKSFKVSTNILFNPYSDVVLHLTVSLWGGLNVHAGTNTNANIDARHKYKWRNWHTTYMTLYEDNFVGMTFTQQASGQKLLTALMLQREKSVLWFIERRNLILFVYVIVCIWFDWYDMHAASGQKMLTVLMSRDNSDLGLVQIFTFSNRGFSCFETSSLSSTIYSSVYVLKFKSWQQGQIIKKW